MFSRKLTLAALGIVAVTFIALKAIHFEKPKVEVSSKKKPFKDDVYIALHKDVRVVLSAKSQYRDKIDALVELRGDLNQGDVDSLLDYILAENHQRCSRSEWHHIMNDVLNKLRQQSSLTNDFTPKLIELYSRTQDDVTKDYVIQHLRAWYADRGINVNHENDAANSARIIKFLISCSKEFDKVYCGTALIGLCHIHEKIMNKEIEDTSYHLSDEDMNSILLTAMSSPDCHKSTKISCIQLCATRNLKSILPEIRRIIETPKLDNSLKLSSIAGIGILGDKTDIDTLKKIAKHRPRLAQAANPAIKKIYNRIK